MRIRGYFSKPKWGPRTKKFGKRWSTIYSVYGRRTYKHGVLVQWCWQLKNRSTRRKKPAPVSRTLHQVPEKALVSETRMGKRPAPPWHSLPVARLKLLKNIISTPQIQSRRTVCCQIQQSVCTKQQSKPVVFKPWTAFRFSKVRKTEVVTLHTVNEI